MSYETAPCPEVTALTALRAATSALHAALDSGLPLSREGAGLQDYVDHLQHLRPWLAAYLTAERDQAPAFDTDSISRKETLLARIDQDLAGAGSPALRSGDGLPDDEVQCLRNVAYRWGVDYVIEGSQLGGSMLYRRFAERLAPHPLAYLRGDGPETGARWRVFMSRLDAAVNTPQAIAAASRGAVDAFHRLMVSFDMDISGPGRQTTERAA